MANVYDIALQYRQELLMKDVFVQSEVLRRYKQSFDGLQQRIDQIRQEMDAGGEISPGALVRLQRYAELETWLANQAAAMAAELGGSIKQAQAAALQAAAAASQATLDAVTPPDWQRMYQPMPHDAFISMVGIAGDGTPVDKLLAQYGYDAAEGVKDALRKAVATGTWPPTLGRQLRDEWGIGATRAMALARTETLRAYREGNRAAYNANSDVVKGWQWLCAISARTCAACLSLDGQQFSLDEPMPQHVNCRCTLVPVLRNRPLPQRQTGAEWFAKQDAATQEKIVGKQGMAALQNGATLKDFVHWRSDPQWGRQALQRTPDGFTGQTRTGNTPPKQRGGRFANHADVINDAQKGYQDWLVKTGQQHTGPQDLYEAYAKQSRVGNNPLGYDEFKQQFYSDPATAGTLRAYLKTLGSGEAADAKALIGKVVPGMEGGAAELQLVFTMLPNVNPAQLAVLEADKANIGRIPDPRAFYLDNDRTLYMNAANGADTYAHEFGHHMEYRWGVAERNAEWVRSRATGPEEKLSVLTGNQEFLDHERALPDSFIDPYAGKVYNFGSSRVQATEVLSLGVENLYRNPDDFLSKDPEHFWLTVGTLLGK